MQDLIELERKKKDYRLRNVLKMATTLNSKGHLRLEKLMASK